MGSDYYYYYYLLVLIANLFLGSRDNPTTCFLFFKPNPFCCLVVHMKLLTTTMTEGAPWVHRKAIVQMEPYTYYYYYYYYYYYHYCATPWLWAVLISEEVRLPMLCPIPILTISGTLRGAIVITSCSMQWRRRLVSWDTSSSVPGHS